LRLVQRLHGGRRFFTSLSAVQPSLFLIRAERLQIKIAGFLMKALLGFEPDVWDYVALGSILALVIAGLTALVFVLGLPGRIAIARKHPEAEAVNLMGWAGFMTVVPWIKALGWAFKPTDVIDIRYFPQQEQRDIEEQIARLKGKSPAKQTPKPEEPGSAENEPKA